jgi:hypothetical protein
MRAAVVKEPFHMDWKTILKDLCWQLSRGFYNIYLTVPAFDLGELSRFAI